MRALQRKRLLPAFTFGIRVATRPELFDTRAIGGGARRVSLRLGHPPSVWDTWRSRTGSTRCWGMRGPGKRQRIDRAIARGRLPLPGSPSAAALGPDAAPCGAVSNRYFWNMFGSSVQGPARNPPNFVSSPKCALKAPIFVKLRALQAHVRPNIRTNPPRAYHRRSDISLKCPDAPKPHLCVRRTLLRRRS